MDESWKEVFERKYDAENNSARYVVNGDFFKNDVRSPKELTGRLDHAFAAISGVADDEQDWKSLDIMADEGTAVLMGVRKRELEESIARKGFNSDGRINVLDESFYKGDDVGLGRRVSTGVAIAATTLAGVLYGYSIGSDWSVSAANYLNETSHLWAPVSGLAQIGFTLAPSAVGGFIGLLTSSEPLRYVHGKIQQKKHGEEVGLYRKAVKIYHHLRTPPFHNENSSNAEQ